MTEPRLTTADVDAWDAWMRAASVHARTLRFARRVDAARAIVDRSLAAAPRWALMWSGGKDSTVMAHLVCAAMGVALPVASEKDDLDYPGELAYVERLAESWRADLHVLTPPFSPSQWIADHAPELSADDDMHSRAAGLSKACFYDVVEDFGAPFDGVLLGLRQQESNGRRMNRSTRGPLYRKRPTGRHPTGQWVSTPLVDWDGLDVYAYAESRGIELLPLYRCISFAHRDEPWRVRKSWWLPGAASRHGGVAWLRRYWPSLYGRLCGWLPDARRLA